MKDILTQKLKEFSTIIPTLQEMLKGVLEDASNLRPCENINFSDKVFQD